MTDPARYDQALADVFGGVPAPNTLIPSAEDSLPRSASDPPGWHLREATADGYPLMGSSPAERAESAERSTRLRKQAEITSHAFEGGGPYCQATLIRGAAGNPTTGVITMSSQCGYPADLHVGRESS